MRMLAMSLRCSACLQENHKLEQENQRVIMLLASNAKSENRGVLKDILNSVERLQRDKAKVSHSSRPARGASVHACSVAATRLHIPCFPGMRPGMLRSCQSAPGQPCTSAKSMTSVGRAPGKA